MLWDLFDHTPYAMVFVDPSGHVRRCNDQAAVLLGSGRDQLVGTNVRDLFADTDRERARELFEGLVAGRPCADEEVQVGRGDGSTVWVRLTRRPVHDPTGELLGAFGILVPSADPAPAPLEGLAGGALQAAALASVASAVMVTEPDGTIVWVNQAFTAMSGYTAAEAVGATPRLLKSGVQGRDHYDELWATIRDRQVWRGEIVDRRKDGTLYTVMQTITPIMDDSGQVTHFVAVHEDVTQLRSSQARLQALFDHALDAIVLFDDAGGLVAANPAVAELTGYTPEQLTRLTMDELVPDSHRASYDRLWEQFEVHGQTRARLPVRRADGQLTQVEHQAVAGIADGVHLLIARDVTDQHRAEAQQRFQAHVLEAVGEAVIAVDLDGIVGYVNPAAEQLFGLTATQVVGRPVGEVYDGLDAQARISELLAGGDDPQPHTRQATVTSRDGSSFTALVTVTSYRDASGEATGAIAVVTDVTDLEATRRLLEHRARQQAAVAEVGQEAMRTDDPRAVAEFACRLADELLGDDVEVALDWRSTPGPGGPVAPVRVDVGDTGALTVSGSGATMLNEQDREFLRSLAHVLQATRQRHAATSQLEHLATHDPLTGLANRTLFLDRVEQARATCQRHGGRFTVLFVDLDGFKTINDGLGHETGDEVLRQVADHLQHILRPTDTLSRFGGDEFALLCPGIGDPHDAAVVARRIHTTLAAGVDTGTETVSLTASIGIVFGDHTTSGSALLRDADTAMYEAKATGRNRDEVFDERMRDQASQRFHSTARLQDALNEGRIEVRYQPTIEPATGRIVGVEALARLRDADGNLLSPADFIPVAEETGLIDTLGKQVLHRACTDARTWVAVDPDFMLAVNLSPRQITRHDIVTTIRDILDDTGLDPDRLWLEITESALLAGPGVHTTMHQLRSRGIRFAIDDFGTGYSSLAHLRQMPVDMLKIDRSFVSGLQDSIQDHALVTATIYLARTFGLPTTAEGVETREQLAELTELGCDYAQGYYWSPPTEAATITRMLHEARNSDNGDARDLPYATGPP